MLLAVVGTTSSGTDIADGRLRLVGSAEAEWRARHISWESVPMGLAGFES